MTADSLEESAQNVARFVFSQLLMEIQPVQGMFGPEGDCGVLVRNGVTSYKI